MNNRGSVGPSAVPRDESKLSSEFVEEVGKGGRFGEPLSVRRMREVEEARKREARFDFQAMVEKEGGTLEFLTKAAWFGVYSLLAVFLLTHLVIVGDWVGKNPAPTLHPPPQN
jgi:hypothetical protein